MENYTDIDGNLIAVPELTWLEDGRDIRGHRCSRYAVGNEERLARRGRTGSRNGVGGASPRPVPAPADRDGTQLISFPTALRGTT